MSVRNNVETINHEFEKMLEKFAKKHGCNISVKSFRFSSNGNFRVSLEGNVSKDVNVDERNYTSQRLLHPKLPPFNSIVEIRGKQFTVIGYNSRARKYKFLIEHVTTKKVYKTSLHDLTSAKIISK